MASAHQATYRLQRLRPLNRLNGKIRIEPLPFLNNPRDRESVVDAAVGIESDAEKADVVFVL